MNSEELDFGKLPRASDVVRRLLALISEYGDLPVCADDPDTGYRMPIGLIYKSENAQEGWPGRFEVKTEYYSTPDGLVERDKHKVEWTLFSFRAHSFYDQLTEVVKG